MSEPQFNDEIGRLYHSQASLGATIRRGDTITFAGVYRLAWWKRALIWLRLMRQPDPPPPLRQFVVTWMTGTD